MENKIDWKIVCTGILALTTLEIYALSRGINGWILGIVMTIIGLAIGVTIPTPKILERG